MKTSELKPLANNPRKITKEAMQRLQDSIKRDPEYMVARPLIVGQDNVILGGNQRWRAIKALGMDEIPEDWVRRVNWNEEKARRFAVVDNAPPGMAGEFDLDLLREHWLDVGLDDLGLEMDVELEPEPGLTDPDEVPEPPEEPVTKPGDLWVLGEHRILCGDSTRADDVELVMDGEQAALLHADPPYGMGKEKDGVQNDNLYRDKLDAFQMQWWRAFRPFLTDNASAYIWGTAQDLWRLWYVGGLRDSERLTLRNEIVWAKGHGQGMESEQHRMFPAGSERCLFFMLGEVANIDGNKKPINVKSIISYIKKQAETCGFSNDDLRRIAGHSTKAKINHWTHKSVFRFPQPETYQKWQDAAKGKAFNLDYNDLKREYDDLKREFYATRAYFDNTHDNMTDVWEFKRVTGEERHGHATPKPVDMMCRAVKSSAPGGGIVVEPFLGSGSTLMACEKTGRKCRAIEISPAYVDVAVRRWENFTGKQAERIPARDLK